VIILENVEEFKTWGPLLEDEKGNFYPDPAKKGELANKTQTKVNIIRKVERGELIPEDALVKKIEYVLGIKLTEGVAEPDRDGRKGESRVMTLGDLIKVKRDNK
jgi:uncharacterized protein (TIGR00270 family)